MSIPVFEPLLAVQNETELHRDLTSFTRDLGFKTFSAGLILDHPDGSTTSINVHNTPPAYLSQFLSDEAGKVDPVMQHCKNSFVPIEWNSDFYQKHGRGEMHDFMASHGYQSGIATANHMPNGVHFFMGFDANHSAPKSVLERQSLIAHLQLIAIYTQEVALRLFLPKQEQMIEVSISPRELEVLKWTRAGKTAWEAGRILGISDRTAALHLSHAAKKLGVNSKHQAVLKAISMGLID